MKGWRYIAQRLPGDSFIDLTVPLEDVEITDVLSGDNSLTGTIPARYNRLVGQDGLPVLMPWASAIWAEKDGIIRGGGIVTDVTPDGGQLQVSCVGYTGYLDGMPYTGSGYVGVGVDPLDVVRTIWSYVQDQPNGDLGLVLSGETSPVRTGTELTQPEYDAENGDHTYQTEAYKLSWYKDNNLRDNVNNLASQTPFDYHERHAWAGDSVAHFLDLGYPRIGTQRTDLRFALNENVLAQPQVSFVGDDYATDTFVLGAGEGATQINATQYRERVGLRRVAVVVDSSLRSIESAQSRALAELAWRKNIQEIDSFTVRDHPNAPLGSFSVGDEVWIQGRLPWTLLGTWVRISEITIRPSDPDSISIQVIRTDKLA